MKNSKFLPNVYLLMTIGLFITGLIGYAIGNDPDLISYIVTEKKTFTTLGWVVLLFPLLLVWIMGSIMENLGALAGIVLFGVFAILEGASLSVIFLTYTKASIFLTFSVTAITFLVMSIVGYTTKKDLSKWGSLLMMALIGLIVSLFLNLFIGSETLDYIISAAGVLLFVVLIAYDTQKLKEISLNIKDEDTLMKESVWGALSLYLDFINLFLFLLRFLGVKTSD